MKRTALALFGLVTACTSGTVGVVGDLDGSSDAGPTADDASEVDASDAGPNPCDDAGVPPPTLACTGLYANFATKTLAANAMAYTPASPLWSDGAQKARWIILPAGTQIDITNPNEWTFPVGTKLFKEFRVNGQRVETRLFQKTTATFWVYATYAWSSDATAATINYGGPVPVGDDGGTWTIPSNGQCDECHEGRQDRILGFEQVGLGLPNAQGLTLAQLAAQGLVTPAPANVALTIGDDGTGLDSLAMGWIHVNCGVTCHNSNPGAAGYGAGMLLRLDPTQLNGSAPSAASWDILRTTINVPCVSGGVAGEPRILPGDPSASALVQLITERGTVQMPPIATAIVDAPDDAVVKSWIAAMAEDGGSPVDDDAGEHDAGHHRDGGELDASGRDAAKDEDGSAVDAGPPDATVTADASEDAAPDTGASDAGARDGGEDAGGEDGGPG